jgi:hypothetical protein
VALEADLPDCGNVSVGMICYSVTELITYCAKIPSKLVTSQSDSDQKVLQSDQDRV